MSLFPRNAQEALVMLYLQNQDLSGKTPSEINTMYWEALEAITPDYSKENINYQKKYHNLIKNID